MDAVARTLQRGRVIMRLIDADEFKKQIVAMAILNNYPPSKANALCELIDRQPTAYDLDKVIEKLQVLSDKADDDIAVCEADTCQYYDGYGDGMDKAIEIVKSEWE